jgi:tripartite-type tricarboxylate transporter receptor subunit TctC
VPRGTPAEIVERLNREINSGLADPAMRKRFDDLAGRPLLYTPAEFGVQIPVHRGQSFQSIADSVPVIADSF